MTKAIAFICRGCGTSHVYTAPLLLGLLALAAPCSSCQAEHTSPTSAAGGWPSHTRADAPTSPGTWGPQAGQAHTYTKLHPAETLLCSPKQCHGARPAPQCCRRPHLKLLIRITAPGVPFTYISQIKCIISCSVWNAAELKGWSAGIPPVIITRFALFPALRNAAELRNKFRSKSTSNICNLQP